MADGRVDTTRVTIDVRLSPHQAYKEFKIVTFYDPTHTRQHMVGTSGDHRRLGRLMRRARRPKHPAPVKRILLDEMLRP